MPSRRRLSLVDGRHTFRSRLKRALSLSSSESSNEARSQRPEMNHSARHAMSSDNNGAVRRRKVGIEADNQDGYQWRPWEMKSENETSRPQTAFDGEPEQSTQNSIIALKCGSESLADSVNRQVAWNETIRHDLEDALSRLATMETRMKDSMFQKKSAVSRTGQPIVR
ncbi:hypothetical protein N7533_010590 [Penicillium manginii]|uniref:uncharacterized protein n=1 Tax=Penicillium manginii TaxID=203109 RepID=UPI002546640C|nr:uncharacterized protein N7533_010590 [Penicillium manginii]KAJ5743488.1 hypothetical protein N7533_010590 [Penicillium manginii]